MLANNRGGGGGHYDVIHLNNTVGYYASSCSHDAPRVPDLHFIMIINMRTF